MILQNFEEMNTAIEKNSALAIYFSTPDCNVCKALKPKFIDFLSENFPKIKFAYVDLSEQKEISGQLGIFAAPTILFFFEGKELFRKSRNLNFEVLFSELSRPYKFMFE